MPVVPKNTISEPKHVRLPQINMAEPHTAQAMGAVTSALGRRAASIGRLGDLAGASARQTAEMGNQQMRILQAGAAAEQAKWSALGKIGSQMMDFGFKLEAIQERKAYQNARDAQTAFTSALDGIVFGRVDEASGERIPGTIETPYTPGGKDRDPDGPSLATTKAIRELLEQQDTPWANLDARARREFDNYIPRIQQEVMRKVYVAEGDQIMQYRQAQEKRAVDTFFSHLGQLGAGMTSADTANWTQAFNDGFNDFIMGQVGQYWDADKKEWINPDVERYVKDTRRDMLETAVAQRVDGWLELADAEQNAERREALLTMAEGYASEYKGMDGRPVLSDLAIAGTKKKAAEVRFRAVQRDNRLTQQASETVKSTLDNFMEAPTQENQQALQESLASPYLTRTDAEAAQLALLDHRVNTQIGMLRHLMATDPAQAQKYMGTMDAAAIAKWNDTVSGGTGSAQDRMASWALDRLDVAIATGGTVKWVEDKNGNLRPYVTPNLHHTQLRGMAEELWAQGIIDKKQYDARIEKINARKKEPDFIAFEREEAIRAMEEILGTDIVDNAITVQNGIVALADDDGKPLDIFATGRERMPYKGQSYVRSDGTIVSQKDSKGIELDAKAVVAVLQYVTDYYRTNPGPDPKTGMAKTTRDIVRDLLMPGPNQPVEVHNSLRFKTQANAERWSRQLYDLQSRYVLQQTENVNRQYGISQ